MAKKAARKTPRRAPKRPTPKPRTPARKTHIARIKPDAVLLTRVKGTPERGGGPEGEAWRIEADGKRAGTVFVNIIDEPPIGRHASIQIFLNLASQGRGIGRIGYQMACEQSVHDPIYAHMRKSNTASRKAAEAAGFRDVTPKNHTQLIMKRTRSARL
jgi:hypothetical protein